MAIAAIKALAEAGRRVPQDCSIIAIDGLEISQYTLPTLTTMAQPTEEMARMAGQQLLEQIEDPKPPAHTTVLHSTYIPIKQEQEFFHV